MTQRKTPKIGIKNGKQYNMENENIENFWKT
jgi:hypothetical protein